MTHESMSMLRQRKAGTSPAAAPPLFCLATGIAPTWAAGGGWCCGYCMTTCCSTAPCCNYLQVVCPQGCDGRPPWSPPHLVGCRQTALMAAALMSTEQTVAVTN
jgi:hypothetical protein